jgi:hypothetical protein
MQGTPPRRIARLKLKWLGAPKEGPSYARFRAQIGKAKPTDTRTGGVSKRRPDGVPICGENFLMFGSGALLSKARIPLGYLCEKCFLGGPAGASARVRARAEELCSLLTRAKVHFPDDQWANMRRSMEKRMEYWLSLANEIEGMTW